MKGIADFRFQIDVAIATNPETNLKSAISNLKSEI